MKMKTKTNQYTITTFHHSMICYIVIQQRIEENSSLKFDKSTTEPCPQNPNPNIPNTNLFAQTIINVSKISFSNNQPITKRKCKKERPKTVKTPLKVFLCNF